MPSSSSCTTDEKRGSSVRRLTVTTGIPAVSRDTALSCRSDAGQDQTVDAARAHGLDDLQLAPRIAVGVGQNGDIAVSRQPVLDAADDRRKHRVGDVGDDHADRARAVGLQQDGRGVRPVAAALAGAPDLLDEVRRDRHASMSGLSAREIGRDMHADVARNVLQASAATRFGLFTGLRRSSLHGEHRPSGSAGPPEIDADLRHRERTVSVIATLLRTPSRTDRSDCRTCTRADRPRPAATSPVNWSDRCR